jgi:hypothetical protein
MRFVPLLLLVALALGAAGTTLAPDLQVVSPAGGDVDALTA